MCDRCKQEPRSAKWRYCKKCLRAMRAEMKASGYMRAAPKPSAVRSTHRMTKDEDADANGGWGNVVKALDE